ncbi:MAG: sulfatase [Verrucomicrobiota bacterium]
MESVGLRQKEKTSPKLTSMMKLFSKALIALLLALSTQAASSKPNFIIIFTDDQGYADLGCFGGKHIDTPRIDQMAAEGARLTSFYSAAPLCTPSRAALMTGSYPIRIDMATGSNFPVLLAGDKKGLHPDEVTIAEVLKSAGYKTGIFGKWHLGDQPEFLPTRQGFDEFFGIPYSHDIHPFHPSQKRFQFPPLPLLENETVIELDPDADYLTQRITERAVAFIQANSDRPFFLYMPHPLPHRPIHASPPFMEDVPAVIAAKLKQESGLDYNTRDKLLRQGLREVDWSVGQILDTLKSAGLDENTFVIFTSDNGPSKAGKATPLSGKKGSTLEGGMRVPTVVRWPARIAVGQNIDTLMSTLDLLPTFAALAGAPVPQDRVIDGKNILPALAQGAPTPHDAFYYHRENRLEAIRHAHWKLRIKNGNAEALFDLDQDIGEQHNLIYEHPEIVDSLLRKAAQFQDDVSNNRRPAAYVENPTYLTIQ